MAERIDNDAERPAGGAVQFGLAMIALAWAAAADATASRSARGIGSTFSVSNLRGLIEAFFLIFLLLVGFRVLEWTRGNEFRESGVAALPLRRGWATEFASGAAIGWGVCLVAVLPLLFTGNLHGLLHSSGSKAGPLAIAVATLLATTLSQELIFRGYAFRRLIRAAGASWASLLLSIGFGLWLALTGSPKPAGLAFINGTLLGLILAVAYLRTHGLWVGWGFHFAYRVIMAVVLGLPISGRGVFDSLAETYATGPRWLSGGEYGLDAALMTAFALLAAVPVLYRVTREWAWQYTHRPIVAAGYEVTVAPPAAHVAMEKAAAPPPLVQILPVTPGYRPASNEAPDKGTPQT